MSFLNTINEMGLMIPFSVLTAFVVLGVGYIVKGYLGHE